MPSTYSSLLRYELIATGEQSGTWGATTNTNLGTLVEQSIAGRAAVSMADANYTLTTANGATDEARQMILNIASSVPLTAARNVVVPTSAKLYVVKNATTGGKDITVKTTAGTGIVVKNGLTAILFCDATNVVSADTYFASGITVPDNVFTLQDDVDATKQLQFQLSSITTASTRTVTIPDSNTTIPIVSQPITFSGPTAARTYTLPDAALTIPAVTTKGDLLAASGSAVLARQAVGTDGQIFKAASGQATGVQWVDNVAALGFIIDGGGAVPTTGVKGDLLIPFACTINSATLQADASGSAVVDIWKKTYTLDSPPTVANTITAAALPTLASHQSAQDATLTGWTTAIAANDMLRFNLNSVTTCQRLTLTLKVTKT